MKIVPNGWSELSLGDVARYINGRAFKGTEWSRKGLPIIRIQNLNDREKEFNYFDGECDQKHCVENGDILISWSASLGVYVWDRGPAVLNQHIFKVLPNESLLDRRYYVHAVQTILDEMKSRVHGATMRHIVKGDFQSLKIPVPPLATQRRIAEVLGRGERLQRFRQEANHLTNKIIQSVFLKMFGDPVQLKGKYRTKKLKDLALKRKYAISSGPFGSNLGTKDYVQSGGVLVVRGTNVKANEFDPTDCKYVTREKATELTRSLAGPRDLVVVAVGASGRACIIPSSIHRCLLSQNCNKISLDESVANAEYVCYLINTEYFQSELSRMTTDTVRKFLSMTNLANFEVPLPPIEQQQRFAGISNDIASLEQRQRQSAQEIDELFHSLMHKAFRGELVA